jgi:phosphoribosylformylglycinamidine synthase PurS subunit
MARCRTPPRNLLRKFRPSLKGRVRESEMKARVFVTLKNGVLDPQGKAIGHALNGLGFGAVGEVRQGKVIDLELSEKDEAVARAALKDMCEKLLANTVIEKYEIELKG